jgi:hypothetical protein
LDYINLNFDLSELLKGKIRIEEIEGGGKKIPVNLHKSKSIFRNVKFRLAPSYTKEKIQLSNVEVSADLGPIGISSNIDSLTYSERTKALAVTTASLNFGSNKLTLTGEYNFGSGSYKAIAKDIKIDAQQLAIVSLKLGADVSDYISQGNISGNLKATGSTTSEVVLSGNLQATQLRILKTGTFNLANAKNIHFFHSPEDLQVAADLTIKKAKWTTASNSYLLDQASGPANFQRKKDAALAKIELDTKAFRLVSKKLTIGPISGKVSNGVIKNTAKETNISMDIDANQLELASQDFSINKTAHASSQLAIWLPNNSKKFKVNSGINASNSTLSIFKKNLEVKIWQD